MFRVEIMKSSSTDTSTRQITAALFRRALLGAVVACTALSPTALAFVQLHHECPIAWWKSQPINRRQTNLWERLSSNETEGMPREVYSWNTTSASSSTIFDQSAGHKTPSVSEQDSSEKSSLQSRIREVVHHRPEHYHLPNQQLTVDHDTTIDEDSQSVNEDQGHLESATLGDIMSSGLVTEPRHSLQDTYGFHNPLDRMVLTANGNLQRLISSYYDSAVSVYVDSCTPRRQTQPSNAVVWDRVVHLMIFNQTFCVATSVITVRDPLCVKLVDSGKVGLGQLFRYLDLLPEFCLVDAARNEDRGGFWREYTLECAEVSCRIHESFVDGLWELPNEKMPS